MLQICVRSTQDLYIHIYIYIWILLNEACETLTIGTVWTFIKVVVPVGLFKTTAVTPVVYADLSVERIWLSSLIIFQCDCAAVMQSYSARWVWGQNKYPWLFLERRVITGVHMTLSDIFIFYCCWPTWALLALGNFKKNNSIFSSTGDAG